MTGEDAAWIAVGAATVAVGLVAFVTVEVLADWRAARRRGRKKDGG